MQRDRVPGRGLVDAGEGVVPTDGLRGDGVKEQRTEVRAVEFGTVVPRLCELVQDELATLVVEAEVLVFVAGNAEKAFVEASGPEGELASIGVHVENATLGASLGGGVTLEDRGGDAVKVQDTREDEAAGAGAKDGDAWMR